MGINIEDGLGTGKQAGVDQNNRLLVRNVNSTFLEHQTFNGLAFNVWSTFVTLTTANESGILYLKNTDPLNPLVITETIISLGASTGGAGLSAQIRDYQNPTTGTLISGASGATVTNVNFGSATVALATAFKGTTGSSVTNGINFSGYMLKDSSIYSAQRSVTITNGGSFAVSVQPPTGNTSIIVSVVLRCYFYNEKIL